MIRLTCLPALFLILLGACESPSGSSGQAEAPFMEGVDTTPVFDTHTSRIALDFKGTYQGILPCGDCDGIETTIVILDDEQFEKRLKHLGRDKDAVLHSAGAFSWEASGGVIRLHGEHGFTRFMVAENFLVHMEDEGDRYSGDLGNHYVLEKTSEQAD